jgi:hypothetical protein
MKDLHPAPSLREQQVLRPSEVENGPKP